MPGSPLITLFVYAFNHERFIREAVEGAFAQTYSPLEIILSDDCSTDRTYEIMQEMASKYTGPHKLILNRNEKNLGITAHLNKIMEISSGEWLVLGAGDDISLPQRVETIAQVIEDYPRIYGVATSLLLVNEHGETQGEQRFRDRRPFITGASMAWHRECWRRFGPIAERSTAEDVIIPFRALLLGSYALFDEPTIKYRMHADSVSSPTHTDYAASLKHLHNAKSTLIAACRQRLSDLNRVAHAIDGHLHGSIEEHIGQVIAGLEESRHSICEMRSLCEASLAKRICYLLRGNIGTSKCRGFAHRLKRFILSDALLRPTYFRIQRTWRPSCMPTPNPNAKDGVRLLHLRDLLDVEIGPLIML